MSARVWLAALLLVALVGLSACGKKNTPVPADPLLRAYDTEPDWNDPQHLITLNYEQAQGKRLFYDRCVWCHADATPAGPSNRNDTRRGWPSRRSTVAVETESAAAMAALLLPWAIRRRTSSSA